MSVSTPQAGSRSSRPRLRAFVRPALVAAGAAAGLTVLAVRDPNVAGSYGLCPVQALTGFACPGCGSLRGLHALTQGDVALAWSFNPLLLVAVALLAGFWVAWVVRTVRDEPRRRIAPAWLLLASAVLVVVYAVARNVPALTPFLGPLGVG